MHSFIAYIDESGDEGINPHKFRAVGKHGSTHWLTLSALIVRAANDLKMVDARDQILNVSVRQPKKREVHFRNLNHEQKLFACKVISCLPVRVMSVMSNKTTIPSHPRSDLFSDKNTLYQYITKYLVERISQCCATLRQRVPEGDGKVKIIFSRRGGMSYDDFKDYLTCIRDGNTRWPERNFINWGIVDIETISAQDHSARAGLQLADCVASAFSAAVEPNIYGMTEPRYAQILKSRVHNVNGTRIGHGLKYVPQLNKMTLTDEQRLFLTLY